MSPGGPSFDCQCPGTVVGWESGVPYAVSFRGVVLCVLGLRGTDGRVWSRGPSESTGPGRDGTSVVGSRPRSTGLLVVGRTVLLARLVSPKVPRSLGFVWRRPPSRPTHPNPLPQSRPCLQGPRVFRFLRDVPPDRPTVGSGHTPTERQW